MMEVMGGASYRGRGRKGGAGGAGGAECVDGGEVRSSGGVCFRARNWSNPCVLV